MNAKCCPEMRSLISRRESLAKLARYSLAGVAAGALPAWMPRLAFSASGQPGPGDTLLCIFQRGGMDGLSAVVPYGDAFYYNIRPTIGVPAPGGGTNAAIDLDGYFGMHPSLAPLKAIYDTGKLAVVHATGGIDPTRSHFDAQTFMEMATPGTKSIGTGWIGRHLESASWVNGSPFRAVGFGGAVPISLRGGGTLAPLAVYSLSDFGLDGRYDEVDNIRAQLAQFYNVSSPAAILDKQAKLVFDTIDLIKTFSIDNYAPANGAVYPDTYFGAALKQVALLVKAGVGLETACVDIDGWDTHSDEGTNGGYFAQIAAEFAQGISAFYTDLGAAMQNVVIVTMSEFGRCAGENASRGTDHGHGNAMFVAGGGVNGGKVYTTWPTLAPDKLDDVDLAITTDQRDVLAELVDKRLKNSQTDKIFPGFTPNPPGIFTTA